MSNIFLFNKKTKEVYAEICPWYGQKEVVFFDTIAKAERHKPSKKWSICIGGNRRKSKIKYPYLFSKYTGFRAVFNLLSVGKCYADIGFKGGSPHLCRKYVEQTNE